MKCLRLLPMMALAMTSLTGCVKKPDTADLTLLFTTDLHGAIMPYDFNKDREATNSMANVAAYVKEIREKNPSGVILLDGGDFLQGQPSIYYSNFEDTLVTHLQARVMNYVGYDAAAVGNHDIEPGEAVYSRIRKQFSFPWLAANAIDTRTGKPFFQPYTVICKNGVKIAVLGMITPNIPAWLPKTLWPHIEFEDMVETARKWVPYIIQKEKPDLMIGLFHAGTDYTSDGNTLDTYKNENGGVPAAKKVDGFDLILLGHDHREKIDSIVNDFGHKVIILNAQTDARYMGRADIHLRLNKGKYEKQIVPSLVAMKDYPADTAFVKTFAPDVEKVNKYIDSPIGVLSDSLFSEPGLFGPSAFMDLIHNAQLEATGADISFAGILSPNAIIPKGEITMRHLFTLYKYENLLYTMRFTGEEVRRFLEYGFSRQYNQMRSESDHLLNFKKDENGNLIESSRFGYEFMTPTFNFTSAAGIRYTVDVTKPEGKRVTVLSMSDGAPFDPDKMYKVAINSYQASGGGGFLPDGLGWSKEEAESRIVDASPKDVRKYIAEYISRRPKIVPESRGDWKVVPDIYFEQGMRTDRALMHRK